MKYTTKFQQSSSSSITLEQPLKFDIIGLISLYLWFWYCLSNYQMG